ncbi:MAG: family 78 glycoside hydrolase catalytic domain [Anaerocolumna sp.]
MNIINMKCNRITNPIGYHMNKPVLSWLTVGEEAKVQLSCQVLVAIDEGCTNILHDSGKREDIDGIGYALELDLKKRTRYFWKVMVWTELGLVTSPVAWFETSKMEESWSGKWITSDSEDKTIHPIFRKTFTMSKEIDQARLYITGLGVYEAYINGERVGEEHLTPYCNNYDNWIQYQTFDVTNQLKSEDNCIGVSLGNGWYKGRFGFEGRVGGIYGDSFALLCELIIQYKDGSEEIIGSDDSWRYTKSYILDSNIYDGEVQDANQIIENWSIANLIEEDWENAGYIENNYNLVEPRRSIPVVIKETIKPVKVLYTPKGETVLDMGQNMVGWISFTCKAAKDAVIYLQYGEEMQEGCFYRENLRSAKAEFKYISDGKCREVSPHFTFYGFRYVKVEGFEGDINLEDFMGHVVYSDLEQIGTIETSNEMVNRLFQNALWGQKGNFLDVPTDCPQRDERMGWTGDAQMFSGTACFNMDSDAFFHKYLYDLAREQKELGGIVPHTVPSFGMCKKNVNDFMSGGSCAWSEAATVIPWNLYLHYGDKSILEQQLESMLSYVDYIRRQDDGSRLWNTGFHFGDWLALDGTSEFNPFGGTPNDLIATAFYAYSAMLVAKAAKVLGKEEICTEYQRLSDEVKEAFCEEFISPRGRLAADTQTSYILALFMDLAPEKHRKRIVKGLVKNLKDNKGYLKTGFVGTPYFCRVLSENGYNDLAYQLLLNEEFPSWLYEVKLGATTIWERWNSLLPDGKFGELGMNSLNHYTYGSIAEWMYRNMCGINPIEEAPGFRRIRLTPQPNERIKHVKASIQTAAGLYESGWCYKEDGIHYSFTIPFHAKAKLILPGGKAEKILINGVTVQETGLKYTEEEDFTMILTTGKYEVIQQG